MDWSEYGIAGMFGVMVLDRAFAHVARKRNGTTDHDMACKFAGLDHWHIHLKDRIQRIEHHLERIQDRLNDD